MAARPRAGSAASGRGYEPPASPAVDTAPGSGPTAESFKKLDQIIQNFHTKAASVITESRMNLKSVSATKGSGSKKINKWFQLDTEDFEDFKEDLRIWRTCSALDNRPPPLIIETYLDTSRLTSSQSLVIVDENGKRWDVMEALNSSGSSDDNPNRVMRRNTDVVLERWRIELKVNSATGLDEFGPILPTIYKKIIVFFRSLYVTARVLPAWKTSQQALNKSVHPALEPKCRILAGDPSSSRVDRLRHPLHDGHGEVVTDYLFADLEVPVGRLVASVTYRNECSFRIDDAESLLSSRFMGVDENFFKPSMPQRTHNRRDDVEVGSLPSHSRGTGLSELRQTYGSLSTFHGEGALGTSPISALKAVRPPGSDTSSPPGSRPASFQPNPPNSLPVRPTMRGFTGGSVRRPLTKLSFSRRSCTVTTEESHVAYCCSSFTHTHRKGRLSFGGQSKAGDDEQGSSGRGSLSSSAAQPGSGLLAEVGGNASSGSLQTDDDQISDFLKALDSKKTLKSFEPAKRGESATNRTVAQLSKFHAMRDSNNALTDSMTSSLQMQRSSSSSSRQLSNVPSMMAPASVSLSSSPGKPLSPHTPHTPAVPSRLSENSVIRYGSSRSARANAPPTSAAELAREDTVTQDGTTAIDIPISPRLGTHQRRSSSVAQKNRVMAEEDDGDAAFGGNRSISLGAEDREPPTLSMLLGRHAETGESATAHDASSLQPAAQIRSVGSVEMLNQGSSDGSKPPGGLISAPSSSPFGRRRYTGMASMSPAGRGQTPPQSSRGSFTASTTGRYGRGETENQDDEPLLFDMSEMDPQGRRSLEEARGGGQAGLGSRAEYEPRGVSRRGW
ncbi:Autophagy-related protein 13 like [Verticillium longisporum]|nr:Autophagy-related protein 13 like [Verticillium longisporum]